MAKHARAPKHPKPHKKLRNPDRPNGKLWKRGLAPEKREDAEKHEAA